MTGTESNAARTALLFADAPGWKDEMPRLVGGLLALQKNGAWQTTTANLWGTLAVERFSRVFESTPVSGQTKVQLGSDVKTLTAPASTTLPWSSGALTVTQEGSGKPWATVESLAAVAAEGTVCGGLSDHEDRDARRSGRQGRALAWRPRARTARHRCAERHDLGGRQRSDSGGRDDSRLGTRPRFGERDAQASNVHKARGRRSSSAASTAIARTTTICRRASCQVEYTVRLNNAGTFGLPPTRVEALYAPSSVRRCAECARRREAARREVTS